MYSNRATNFVAAAKRLGVFVSALGALLLAASGAEVRAAEGRAVRVLGDDSYPPIAYVENGVPKGFDIDVVNALGAVLGRRFEIELMRWDLAQKQVQGGKGDLLIGMSITEERKKTWRFASPVLTHSFGLFVAARNVGIRDVGDLHAKRVGVTAGGFPATHLATHSRATLVPIADYAEGFRLLKSGGVDALAADTWVAGYVLSKHRIDGVVPAGEPFATLDSGFAVPAGRPQLIEEINRGLAQLEARGTLDEIRSRWEPKQVVFLLREQITSIALWAGALALLVLFGGLAAWIVSLRREARIRKNAELELRQVVADKNALLENALVGIAFVREQRLVQCNAHFAKMFGYEPGELSGTSLAQLLAEPDTFADALAAALTTIQAGRHFRAELELRRRDGSTFWGEVERSVESEDPGVGRTWIVIDVTARRKAEAALKESEARFRAVFENSSELLGLVALDGTLLEANRTALKMIGATRDEVVGRPFWDLPWWREPSAQKDELRRIIARAANGEPIRSEAVHYDTLGAPHNIDFIVTPVCDAEGRPLVLVPEGHDVTERKRAESERLALEVKLRQAQKMESIGHLAGGIAHDFNNVLAIITGYVGLARQTVGSPGAGRLGGYLEEIARAAERAEAVVAQLLAFSRSEEAAVDAVIVEPVVRDTVKLMRSTLPASLEVTLDIAGALPDVRISPVQLHQVLTNLALNARDAMEGRGRLAIRMEREHVAALADCTACRRSFDGDFVVLEVADDGPGITAENLARVFDPFFTTKELGKGTGLGLSVVHGIVHAANGHIVVRQAPGRGTRFLVYLPALTSRGRIRTVAALPVPASAPVKGRVLVVDDEPQLAAYLRESLEQNGCEVEACTDPRQALQQFTRDPGRFDLLITDQTMPGLSGSELAGACLALKPRLPVILCTGYSNGINADACARIGIRSFLRKPVPPVVLATTVRELLAGAGAGTNVMPLEPPRAVPERGQA